VRNDLVRTLTEIFSFCESKTQAQTSMILYHSGRATSHRLQNALRRANHPMQQTTPTLLSNTLTLRGFLLGGRHQTTSE
jgi:hypothetical protein